LKVVLECERDVRKGVENLGERKGKLKRAREGRN